MRSSSGFLGLVIAALLLIPTAQAAAAEFPLVVQTEGGGSGTVECDVGSGPEQCDAEYPEGTEIALTAEPDPGSEFFEWGGDCTGQPECEVTMDEAKLVVAVFLLEEVELETFTEGTGSGEVECEVESGPAEECEATYPFDTDITLVAEPDFGSEFVEWDEDCTGSGVCELTMDGDKSVTAVFDLVEFTLEVDNEGTGEGTVTSEPAGIDCGVECSAEYLEGEEVVLTAEPEPGSEFVEWTGCDDEPSADECEVTMDEDLSVSAVFDLIEFTLEIKSEGTGSGEVECEVESGPAEECEASYPEGTEVALVASPDAGSEFVEWKGDCTGSGACELTIDENLSVTAVFDLEPASEFALTVEPKGSGKGTVTSSPAGINCGVTCKAEFSEGETVTLTASPSVGSEFAGWSGCEEEPSPTKCEVTIEEDMAVTATFDLEPPSEFALTVEPKGSGLGTVTSSPGSINCGIVCSDAFVAGTEVTLTATPASGSTFAGWSGACTGTGTCKVTMSQSRSVTATFEKAPTPPPAGTVVVAGTAKVKGGKAQLKLTCTGEGPCKGSLKLTAKIKSGGKTKNLTIGKGSFSLAAGAKKTLKVKLSGPAKKALAKGPLKAKVKGSGVRASTVKLKLAK